MVHLKVDFDWAIRPLYDVIATIPGSEFKNQWVLYGNHHDAWVDGASDPASGASVLMETARTLSILRQQGWQPKRTIVLALWDGEEFGLLGSTEWTEKHQAVVRGRSPRHRGICLGRVVRANRAGIVIEPSQAADLKPGDGLVFDAADWRSPQEPEEGGRLYGVQPVSGGKLELHFGSRRQLTLDSLYRDFGSQS